MADEKAFVKEITPQSEDFSRWYIDTITKADLMDYTPVRGCIVFKPDGFELWERIQAAMDKRFKETGHRNAYFPMLIPESFFQKEKEHVEGFNPELPWVTEAGGEKLEERLALRPTSETIIGHMYSQWIQSYRDLPVLINQWANVFRWEKRTMPFLRTSEFLWQEGHTAHATEEEARQETMQMLDIYSEVVEQELAIPVWKGQKTPTERFAGAVDTYSIEAMMKDGKAVQAGTSHYLGENFARGFDIKFLDRDNQFKYVHTTSWGTSTRLIGSMIMVHGDDRGLALPPRVAPTQVVMIPVGPVKLREKVMEKFDPLFDALKAAGVRVKADLREETPGWKFNEWEMRGVPIRLEIGPRDVDNGQVVLARRDTGEKVTVSLDRAVEAVADLLEEIQRNMFEKALAFRTAHSHLDIDTLDALKAHIAKAESEKSIAGWVLAGWCGDDACEAKVKEETKFTSRNIPFEPPTVKHTCIACGGEAKHTVWFARAY
ncbi:MULTISPECIES: proline--tRNA ligase [Brevibacillus]|jgi:prolyl-tRNA synthetase|uniref:Proline--tRNA ligase n=1 Tax=Brevibacillus thermoruber TaxID=33942 RepID=A0A9X3TTF4_9BACL|nr:MULTISPECIES: proline--tRNA ligase [Brevibacillus]MDA5110070.1 proline--tRNA ligase [Brevibacillus thermoruber]TRY25379.1 proline--tRNA ligase [Brevibacillus sp. LEMMJ03]